MWTSSICCPCIGLNVRLGSRPINTVVVCQTVKNNDSVTVRGAPVCLELNRYFIKNPMRFTTMRPFGCTVFNEAGWLVGLATQPIMIYCLNQATAQRSSQPTTQPVCLSVHLLSALLTHSLARSHTDTPLSSLLSFHLN